MLTGVLLGLSDHGVRGVPVRPRLGGDCGARLWTEGRLGLGVAVGCGAGAGVESRRADRAELVMTVADGTDRMRDEVYRCSCACSGMGVSSVTLSFGVDTFGSTSRVSRGRG